MKKIVLTSAVLLACFVANAQEPEKKKESSTSAPAPSRGQERAINESGVSVKSEPKKNSSSKKSQKTSSVTPVPAEEKKQEVKKPE
jgi:hypothetical protein